LPTFTFVLFFSAKKQACGPEVRAQRQKTKEDRGWSGAGGGSIIMKDSGFSCPTHASMSLVVLDHNLGGEGKSRDHVEILHLPENTSACLGEFGIIEFKKQNNGAVGFINGVVRVGTLLDYVIRQIG
jgi:hypothetical protein